MRDAMIKSSLFHADKAAEQPYQQQLAAKKKHLLAAKQCLHESARLIEQYQAQIHMKQNEFLQLTAQTNESNSELAALAQQKQQLQDFITDAPLKLAPYLQRYEQLQTDIAQFEAQIIALIKELHQTKSQQTQE